MGLLLAFYQELTYEIPPDEVEGRQTLGMRVPTDVLVSGRGDCDSKAVAFASMWRQLPTRLVFIVVPGHALVGVEARALPGEETVRVGNRTFVLCEVAGPAKLRPGAKSVAGSFEYVLVEPA
jgi:transglutaminase-like putative cysteine protease